MSLAKSSEIRKAEILIIKSLAAMNDEIERALSFKAMF